MGQELTCTLDYGGESYNGKALLETSELIFRGETRLKIAFKQITHVQAADGKLHVNFDGGVAIFHLGPAAAKWANKILNPPSRLDKLGLKSGMRVRWIGARDDGFKDEALALGVAFVRTAPDLTFVRAANTADLTRIPHAATWVIYPKGVQHIREQDVRAAGLGAGLVDVKVASFSPTHTALKFVPRSVPARKKASPVARD